MKATILLPCFNKRDHIARTLEACLAQTVECDLLIFGPRPTDGTDGVIRKVLTERLRAEYHNETIKDSSHYRFPDDGETLAWKIGNVTVRWFILKPNGYGGMNAGMNHDFNYVHGHEVLAETDICLFCGGDDVPAPNRVERVKWAFETFNCSWVVNKQILMREDGTVTGECPAMPERYSRHVNMVEAAKFQIGSSGGFAWAKDLYLKYAPIEHIESNDVVLPMMACLERGIYYLDEPLQTMYLHDDLANLGVEGQVRGARSEIEALQLRETMAFQGTSNWTSILRRIQQHYPTRPLPAEFVRELHDKIAGHAAFWVQTRADLTMKKVKPLAFGAKALGMME